MTEKGSPHLSSTSEPETVGKTTFVDFSVALIFLCRRTDGRADDVQPDQQRTAAVVIEAINDGGVVAAVAAAAAPAN